MLKTENQWRSDEWAGWAKSRAPEFQAKKLNNFPRHFSLIGPYCHLHNYLQVITIHNYLCCVCVSCTWVKL